jgi:hypothetical protein
MERERAYAHGSLRTTGWSSRQPHTPITEQLIRKYFGKHANVNGCAGCYRVTTPMGGKVVITPNKMRLSYGGDATYSAMTQLAGEVHNNWKARGSREFMLAAIAHGEAWGVNIQPDFSDRWATFKRWCVAIALFWVGCIMLPDRSGHGGDVRIFAVFLLAVACLFWWMKRKARREEQRKIEAGGFHYPRQATGATFADEDELRKGGLI